MRSYKRLQKLFEGTRGEIYLIDYFGKKAVLKKLRAGKPNTLQKEAQILLELGPLDIAPKLYECGYDYIVMEYLEGISMKEALKKNRALALQMGLQNAYLLDCAGIYHKELGRYYHFIFDFRLHQCKIIDFERAVKSTKPRNVLQFVGFYMRDFDTKEGVELYKKNKKAGLHKLLGVIDV